MITLTTLKVNNITIQPEIATDENMIPPYLRPFLFKLLLPLGVDTGKDSEALGLPQVRWNSSPPRRVYTGCSERRSIQGRPGCTGRQDSGLTEIELKLKMQLKGRNINWLKPVVYNCYPAHLGN